LTVCFHTSAWEQYLYWQEVDPRMARRINALIEETLRDPFHGTGKPEPLRNEWSGYWSRRIDREHRLVYRPANDTLLIAQCRFHY
jgi:toxin YoeB